MKNKILHKVVRSTVIVAIGTLCLTWPADTTTFHLQTSIAEAAAPESAIVTGKYVNLRSGPGTNHLIKGKVYRGDKLRVLGQKGDWYKVQSKNGQALWIAGWLIDVQTTSSNVSRAGGASGKTAVVNATDVNLRGGPGTSYSTMGMVDKGDTLSILDNKGDWYKIKTSTGKTAWIAGWLVSVSNSASNNVIGKSVVITASNVNLRQGAGTGHPVVKTVDKGDEMSLLEKKGDWYKVKTSSGQTAWVAGWLVREENAPLPEPAESTTDNAGEIRKYVVITANYVNVRNGPGISNQEMGMVDEGERYQLLGTSGDWYKLKLPDGQEGWVAGWLGEITEVTVPSSDRTTPSRGDADRDNTPSEEDLISWLPPEAKAPMEDDDSKDEDSEDVDLDEDFPRVTDIDVDEEDEKTIITVEADIPLKHSTFMLSNPNRLVFNFEDVALGELPEEEKVETESVQRYRTGQFSDEPVISRLVLDLTGPVHYSTSTAENGRVLTIEIYRTEYNQNVEDKVIFIDPGHGGNDPGAPGYSRSIWEEHVNLDMALKLSAILKQQGANVQLSRFSDRTVDLHQRPELANHGNADIFVSIHSNANPNPSTSGTSTYYYAPYSKAQLYEQMADRRRLAQSIQTEMVNNLGLVDKGIRQANFAVLRGTDMPSVLVETAYMSNPREEQLLANEAFRQKVAESIAKGINAYFGK
ncbi:MAG: AMIN domain-containing protein [Firmicutes bacterium]|nr:AMIN domain-containing protein [Bacillota bacterium]